METVALPGDAIGKVNRAGYARRNSCTGVLIKPNIVLTAAHCLKRDTTGAAFPAEEVHFLAGYDRGKYRAHGRAKTITFLEPSKARGPFSRYMSDAAIIELTEDLNVTPAPLAGSDKAFSPQFAHAGYMKSRGEALSVSGPCAMKAMLVGMWASNCHAEQGSSGGPFFTLTPTGPRVVGIAVAVDNRGTTLVLPLALMEPLLKDVLP